MGFRFSKKFNEVLIAKLTWMVLSNRHSICMNALRSKYKVRSDWLRKDPMKNVSHTWRAIERMKVLVSKGACCMVGDGVDIDVWKDPWVPCLEGYKPMPRNSMAEMGPLTVSSLINSTNGTFRSSIIFLMMI